MTRVVPTAPSGDLAKILGGELINCGQHSFKAAAHIGPRDRPSPMARSRIGKFVGAGK